MVAPHEGSLGTVAEMAAIHLLATLPNYVIHEYLVNDGPPRYEVMARQPVIEDGHILVPDRPGLGADLDENAIMRYPAQGNAIPVEEELGKLERECTTPCACRRDEIMRCIQQHERESRTRFIYEHTNTDDEARRSQTSRHAIRWRYAVLLCLMFIAWQVKAETMVTTNVIYRTFHIQWNEDRGTAFTIDHGKRQYLVTARHVVEGIESGDNIGIFHEKEWKSLAVKVVGIGQGVIDVAVLACSFRLSPSFPLEASLESLAYGQSVAFLGYPFGWIVGGEQINRGIPLPFVKGGIVSAIESGDASRIFLDAHGNEGFSGGPVVFVPAGQATELRVAGVVAYYPTPILRPIVDRSRKTIRTREGEPVAYVTENPGILVAIGIGHALELIEANPIGFPLPD